MKLYRIRLCQDVEEGEGCQCDTTKYTNNSMEDRRCMCGNSIFKVNR